MTLHRDLEIACSSAWHLAHRLREAFAGGSTPMFHGPAEADETCFGGKRKNMPTARRKQLEGRGTAGKTAVAGVKDGETGQVAARKVLQTDARVLQGVVRDHVEPGATLCTDEARACKGMGAYDHEAVNHSVGEYVRDMAHTNGIESFWSMLKRGCQGTFHHIQREAPGPLHRRVCRSPQHPQRRH